jgi:heat shock protein 1/8
MGINIGIDLGTTNSCVAYQNHLGEVNIIANDQGSRTTPSYVTYTDKERLVGVASKNLAITNIDNTVYDAKRLIGRKYDDPQTISDIGKLPYKVVNKDNQPHIVVEYLGEERHFRPEEVSSVILSYLKDVVENVTGETVDGAVITVPAYFNDNQRQATKDAGKLAGLNVLRIINEPTAAAMAYGINKSGNILVFDLGGGTFDVSLLNINSKHGMFKVLATSGDTHLGGEDFDNILVDYLVKEYTKKTGISLEGNNKAKKKIKTIAESCKLQLSSTLETTADLSHITSTDCIIKITRAKLNRLCQSLFQKCIDPVIQVLTDSKIDKKDIDEIVMVGGSTRIPKIQETISNFFDGKKVNLTVNPDEAVAYGAAVQASALSGQEGCQDILLLDVIPLSLGVETKGGLMDVIIPRQSTIPRTETKTYSTARDNQSVVSIKVFEGERPQTCNNNLLGNFDLTGIPPMPKYRPEIEVTFHIDADGILSVSASEKSTQLKKEITINNSKGSFTADELKKKIEEAEKFKEQDDNYKSVIKEKIKFEDYLESVYDSIDNIQNLSPNDKVKLTEIYNSNQEWLDQEDHDDLDTILERKKQVEKQVLSIYDGAGEEN